MERNIEALKPGPVFKFFRGYVRFFHDKIFYRKTYVINKENVPENGTPVIVTSNHQNCLNDPLGLVFSFKERKVNAMARADVFKNPIAAKFLRWIGLVPAFRLMDGEETLGNNGRSFDVIELELLNGRTIIIYPEAGHQDKRWLGDFSLGYLRMAFNAAEKDNFETEIFILPSCNHYSRYFSMREELLVKYGTPISLKPFYELYKTKPRTAQRNANALVRKQIEELMLNIEDLENYEAIDYIRETYGVEYAKKSGFDPENLHDKLLSDKQLVKDLDELKQKDEALAKKIYEETLKLKKGTYDMNVRDWNFTKPFSLLNTIAKGFGFLLLLPLYIFAMYPFLPMFYAPKAIMKKNMDPMFISSLNFGTSVLVTIPLFTIITLVAGTFVFDSFWIALIYLFTLPFVGLFAWYYRLEFIKWKAEIKFNRLKNSDAVQNLIKTRDGMWNMLRKALK